MGERANLYEMEGIDGFYISQGIYSLAVYITDFPIMIALQCQHLYQIRNDEFAYLIQFKLTNNRINFNMRRLPDFKRLHASENFGNAVLDMQLEGLAPFSVDVDFVFHQNVFMSPAEYKPLMSI